MNTPGIEFGRKTAAAYAALCKPLCQKLHLTQTAFDILMFLANNPGYQTASDVVEMRKLKANLVSVNVDRLVQEGYLVREADPADRRKTLVRITPAGERARKANEQAMNDYFARIMARLTPEQLAQANAVKDALLAAIEAENAAMKTDLKGEPPHDENF